MSITIGETTSRGGLNPNESRLFFKSTGADERAFQVRSMEGEEAISRPFRFTLELLADDPNIKASDVVGKKATLTIRDREIHGIVSEFSYKGSTTDEHDYRAVLRPRLWTRSLRRDSEVFLDVAARDVIQAALGGLDFQMQSNEAHPVKEYVAQYNETDLDFLSRTAEHWGISYRFNHEGGSDVVEFFSDSKESPSVKDEALPFVAEQSMRGDRAAASSFVEHEFLVAGRVLVKDYNYRDPETALLSENTRHSDDFESLYYEYGTHHGAQDEGDLLAKVRSEAIECRRHVFTGASNWHELEAGYTFELKEHKRDAFNGRYLITSVTHRGAQAFGGGGGEAEASQSEYENTFTCIPASVPFRPERLTPVPTIPGIMTARTETPGGEYAPIDDWGRYKVRMPFDLGERGQGEATAPIRMNQPYSGPGYGMHFPNHANTEVIWACINGDPNRPLALGTAPNPSNGSPVTSANRAQSVIRTQGQNQIVIDDTRGQELIRIETAGHQWMILADKEGYAGLATVGKHEFQMNDEGKYIQIKTTKGHLLLMDDDAETLHLKSIAGHILKIDDKGQTIELKDQSGQQSITIDMGAGDIRIENKKGDILLSAPSGNIDLQATKVRVKTKSNTTVQAANMQVQARGAIKYKAMNVKLEASANMELKAGAQLTSEAGATHKTSAPSVECSGDAMNTVKGGMVKIEASGPCDVRGLPIKLN
jgi:type VI secretion system secreted protein VgrG